MTLSLPSLPILVFLPFAFFRAILSPLFSTQLKYPATTRTHMHTPNKRASHTTHPLTALLFHRAVVSTRYYATQYVLTHFGFLWRFIASVPYLRNYADRFVIEQVAQQLQFPLPLSTIKPYTTMDSFTDHTYFNRILPPKPPTNKQPDSQQLVDLLLARPPTAYQPDDYSNFLFISFAQWFVDQFLMTNPTNPIKQYSRNVINLCTVYGDSLEVETLLRARAGGRLQSQRIRSEEYPPYITDETKPLLITSDLERVIERAMGTSGRKVDWTKLFAIGHVRMNLTAGCMCFALLFFREHNRVADLIQQAHPLWDNDQVFHTAKNVCIVEVMKIGIDDYVVGHIAAKLQYPLRFHPEVLFDTEWYWNSQRIFIEFDHLYRWHAFVPNTVAINGTPVPLAAAPDSHTEQLLWNTEVFIDGRATLSSLINDMSNAPAGRFVPLNTHPVLTAVEKSTIDAGRAAQLASFNDYRARWGLWRYKSIDDISSNPTIRQRLTQLYHGRVDDVEFYVGLMCEDRGYGNSIFPPLLATMVGAEAFRGVFGNPLLAPAVYNAETFSQVGLDVIEGTSLKSLVVRNIAAGTRRPEHRVSFELPGKRGAAAR